MNVLIRSLYLVIVFLIIICSMSFAKNSSFINNIASIKSHIDNGEVIEVIVSKIKYPTDSLYLNGFMWGADEYRKPRFLITNVEVVIGNNKIFVPLSAYCDLADPNEIKLNINHDSFSLIIYGGDAGCSYIAELIFRNKKIKYRNVFHGEFPDETWEKTEYSFVQDRGQ